MMDQDMIIHMIELLGTFAFAISGIRHAAAKQFDWFGGYVCGVAVAIGGGTIRDVMLGTTPFWMTTPIYLICTGVALLTVAFFGRWMEPLKNAWFVFDTLGLALFTIAGIQKSITFGQPFWVAIIMGCITGSAGGVIMCAGWSRLLGAHQPRPLIRVECNREFRGNLSDKVPCSEVSYLITYTKRN